MLYFLIAYILFIIAFITYSTVGIYHLWRFGYVGDLTKPIIILYSVISSIIIIISLIVIATRPWPIDFNI